MTSRTKILIIEDEEILAENLRDYFLRRMFDARIAATGEAALELATEFRPDLLILDYALPGMNGIETLALLRTLPLRFDCVMITGHPSEEIFHAAQAQGIRQILVKPFAFADLEGILAEEPILVSREGPAEDRRSSEARRTSERRHINGCGEFPLHTGKGWIKNDRRQRERRALSDRRLSQARLVSDLIS